MLSNQQTIYMRAKAGDSSEFSDTPLFLLSSASPLCNQLKKTTNEDTSWEQFTVGHKSSALAVPAVRQHNICCSSAPSTSYSERESGQTTLPQPTSCAVAWGPTMYCHLHRGDWSFHLTNKKKEKKTYLCFFFLQPLLFLLFLFLQPELVRQSVPPLPFCVLPRVLLLHFSPPALLFLFICSLAGLACLWCGKIKDSLSCPWKLI